MIFIKINVDGSMNEIKEKINNKKIISILKSYISNENDIIELYNWELDNYKLICYGCLHGKTINKHKLPESGISKLDELLDSNVQTLYDEIFILKKSTKLCNLSVFEYSEIYNSLVNDEIDINEFTELDIDTNEY